MAWHIIYFLKSLRSLEECRKIPISKFLLNLLLQISKALVYLKINFLFGKEFFLHFQPNRPSGQPAHLAFWPTQPTQPSSSSPRRSSATSSSSRATAPWTPPPPPAPWSHNGRPPNNFPPSLQSAIVTPPLHSR
jgi:hypothetical protein